DELMECELGMTGKYNVYNALAAAAASFASGLSFQDIKRGLEQFTGVDRRLQKLGRVGNCDVFSDYAHHPHEIESTIESLKNAGYARVGIIFEPHTYTRTQSLLNDFADALRHADDVCLAAVYPAREAPIEGVSSHALARALIERGKNACAYDTFCELYRRAAYFTAKCDALAFCGAGIIDRAAAGFFKAHTAE
ncbi:MAG: UDP-N-acetylmuramate--L-alanine ligase, partial [Clostridiales bacterium]|nr:UDP-N-acetylmuramate--L-alanine ligase [Clostridiales bacterium]